MYRILIVEDEEFVRNGIRDTVAGLDLGFCGIEAVGNGIEAMESIDKNMPDVILSDVKMPKMDGLELARYVRKKHPKIQFVLLSAYDNFSYAQEAIRWGVKAYLLKPLKEQLLKQTLAGIINEIGFENSVKNISLHAQKEVFLKNMIKGTSLEEAYIRRNMARFGLPDMNNYFRAAAGVIDNMKKINVEIIGSICQGLCDKYNISMVPYYEYMVFFINSKTTISKSDAARQLELYAKYCCERIYEYYGIRYGMIFGVGNIYRGIGKFHQSYNEAVYSYGCRYFNRNIQHVFYQDLQKKDYADLDDDAVNALVNKIIDSVCRQDSSCIKRFTHEFFNSVLHKGSFLIEHVHTKCLDIIFETGYRLKSINKCIDFKKDEYVKGIQNIKDIEELKEWFEKCLVFISSRIDADADSKDFICKAKEYIADNYAGKITLSSVAEYLHINPAYLSHSFKKTTGSSLVDYINEVRIQQAKKMLQNPEIRIKDMYFKVGFSDYSYFCKVFKKVTGTSPLNFKYQKLF